MALSFAVAAAILLVWLRGRRERSLLNQLPGPRGWPILGYISVLFVPKEDLLQLAQTLQKKYGPVIYLRTLGVSRVVLCGPEAVQALLCSNENLTKESSYRFMKPWLGDGLLTSTDTKWRSQRRTLDPAFHYKILEGFLHVFNANSAILVDELAKRATEDYVEINDYINMCALDNICETAMGTSVHAQKGEGVDYVHAVSQMCSFFRNRHFAPWLHPDVIYYRTLRGREQKRVVHTLQEFSGRVMQKKISEREQKKSNTQPNTNGPSGKKRLCFLDVLLEISDQESNMSADGIIEQVDTFMFAGHDTTAAAMNWALYLLGSHEDIQAKVAAELDSVFGNDGRPPTMDDLKSMTYLEKVIQEVLRLYPSVPAVSRFLDTDLAVGQYTIPAGTNVFMIPFVVHRDPEIYPDPDKFDPERFSPEQISRRHPYAYIPFSAGPRNCIGKKFARLEMMCVLSSIIRAFKLKTLETKIVFVPDVVLKPKHPFKIKISPRV